MLVGPDGVETGRVVAGALDACQCNEYVEPTCYGGVDSHFREGIASSTRSRPCTQSRRHRWSRRSSQYRRIGPTPETERGRTG